MELRIRMIGKDHLWMSTTMYNLAATHQLQGNFGDAVILAEQN